MKVTPIYASLLTFLYYNLSARVIKLRRKNKVAIGHGGNIEVERAMRAHGNFAEYVPLALILILSLELQGANVYFLHSLGLALLAGRMVHAYGISKVKEDFRMRISGMLLTFGTLFIAAIANLVLAFL